MAVAAAAAAVTVLTLIDGDGEGMGGVRGREIERTRVQEDNGSIIYALSSGAPSVMIKAKSVSVSVIGSPLTKCTACFSGCPVV